MVLHDRMELDPGQPDVSPTSGHPSQTWGTEQVGGEKNRKKKWSPKAGAGGRTMPFASAEFLPLPTRTEGLGPAGESRGGCLGQRRLSGHRSGGKTGGTS